MRVLVTGCYGFIGSHFVKHLLFNTDVDIIGFSRHSDSGNKRRLNDSSALMAKEGHRLRIVWGDLANPQSVSGLCEGIDVVVNFAAKTFVDHSLKDHRPFIESNIIGADNLMEDATRYGVKRFVQVSTDEVYGQILTGAYKEDALLQPRNPYCVHPDSQVLTPYGPKAIKDVRVGDFVQGNKIGKNGYFRVSHAWRKDSTRKWYRIKHSYGELLVSADHRCFVANPRRNSSNKLMQNVFKNLELKEVRAEEVHKGMWLAVTRTLKGDPQCNPIGLTAGKSRFIGFFVGNGCCKQLPSGKNKYISTCSGYQHIMEFYKWLVKAEFGNDVQLQKHGSKECWYHNFGNADLWSELLQYGRSSQEKNCKPLLSAGMSLEDTAQFLAGLFDADGSATPGRNVIVYSSVSKELMEDVRFMLARLGILSTLQWQEKQGRDRQYTVAITDAKSIKTFVDKVPQCKVKITCTNKGQRNLSGDDFVYSPILSVEQVENDIGYMVDIEVEEAANFYCDYGLVHNSWSKACADLNAIQRHRTYGFPCIITRTENNFGKWQHRQKVLPTFVRCAMAGEPLPVYGDGLHVRCWLHVEEHCRAIWHLVKHSIDYKINDPYPYGAKETLGEVFHIAGEEEMTNLALARLVLIALGKPETQIKHIDDHNIRPGHDRRYALDCSKLRATGFEIKQDLPALLAGTVRWYAEHPEWTR